MTINNGPETAKTRIEMSLDEPRQVTIRTTSRPLDTPCALAFSS